MNILFISLTRIEDVSNRGLYTDTIRELLNRGHKVTVITALEKRDRGIQIKCSRSKQNILYLFAKTGNITKNKNFIQKGISVVLAGYQYRKELKKHYKDKCDLIICATPCITFETAVRYIKRKDNSKMVLLLKDMWPYDLLFDNVLTKTGWKGIIYKYFERIAEKLFELSDVIGCMTPKNKLFLEQVYNNSKPLSKAVVIPNSIEPYHFYVQDEEKMELRNKYNIPKEKCVFVYGGNLGVAQGPDFIIKAIKNAAEKNSNAFFLIIGNGTDAKRIKESLHNYKNIKCMPALPHDDYEKLVFACDVGLVFLNWNCHTPNSPSRILQYMEASLPVICATDDTTDIGQITEEGGFGVSCKSNDVDEFDVAVKKMLNESKREEYGRSSRKYLEDVFSAKVTCDKIISGINFL